MKILAKILFLVSIAGCITPQKASEKCNNWAQKWPRYFNRDTLIKITRPGTRQAQTFKATPDTNVIRWGNSSLLYRTAPGTPPECDTVEIESVYRTKPDTIVKTVKQVKYTPRKKEKSSTSDKIVAFVIGLLIGLALCVLITKHLE